ARLLDLQNPVFQRDRVVSIHGSLMLDREDPVQVLAARLHKRASFARRLHREAPVELSQVFLAQEAIGHLHSADLADPQFLRASVSASPPPPPTARSRSRW